MAIPTRPTANKDIKLPEESTINDVFQIFKAKMDQVEYLIGYEGNDFGYSGDIEKDILRITTVLYILSAIILIVILHLIIPFSL